MFSSRPYELLRAAVLSLTKRASIRANIIIMHVKEVTIVYIQEIIQYILYCSILLGFHKSESPEMRLQGLHYCKKALVSSRYLTSTEAAYSGQPGLTLQLTGRSILRYLRT